MDDEIFLPGFYILDSSILHSCLTDESRLAAQRVGLCEEETMPRFTLPIRDLITSDSNAEGRGSWASLLGDKFVSVLTVSSI